MFARICVLAQGDLPDDDNKVTDSAIIAGALVGTLNGVLSAWAMQWPDRSMTALMDHALERISPALTTDEGQRFGPSRSPTVRGEAMSNPQSRRK